MIANTNLIPVPADEAVKLYANGSLKVTAAVREYGVPRTAIYDAMADGTLPFAVLNGRRYLARQAIAKWLAAATVASQQDHRRA